MNFSGKGKHNEEVKFVKLMIIADESTVSKKCAVCDDVVFIAVTIQ